MTFQPMTPVVARRGLYQDIQRRFRVLSGNRVLGIVLGVGEWKGRPTSWRAMLPDGVMAMESFGSRQAAADWLAGREGGQL